jgi:hypothetical protein
VLGDGSRTGYELSLFTGAWREASGMVLGGTEVHVLDARQTWEDTYM